MTFICDNCGKGIVIGRIQRHGRGVAGKRWNKRAPMTIRSFKPNVQKVSFNLKDEKVTLNLCAKCIKRFKKEKIIPTYGKASATA